MPKVNINAAYFGANSVSRKNNSASTTNALLSGSVFEMDKQALPIENIPLDKIRKRPVNIYHPIDNLELDESIRQFGLINPIAVCHRKDEDIYTISAGERRYDAITRLHERYPDNPRFQTIECKVYILTEDETELERGFPYITPAQEEGIYRDSNNLARQLSEKDIASQIRYIVSRFENPEYVVMLRRTAENVGIHTYSNPDRYILISSVIKSQGLWGREKIRQYLVVYDSKDNELLDAIEQGEISVNAAYKKILEKQKKSRTRKTTKVNALERAVSALKKEAQNRTYTEEDINLIRQCVEELQIIMNSVQN